MLTRDETKKRITSRRQHYIIDYAPEYRSVCFGLILIKHSAAFPTIACSWHLWCKRVSKTSNFKLDSGSMGNHFSFGRHFQGSLNFWMGPAQRSFDSRFPSCSDELLDWAFEASEMFELYLRKGVSRRGANKADEVDPGKPTCVTFIPFVLKSSIKSVQDLPSMSLLNRMRFLAENVIVVLFSSDRSPAILTLQSFINLHVILVRYLELLKTMKAESLPGESKHLCSICLNDDAKMVVLACSHGLCTKCHARWVSRRLNCPFCRQYFSPRSLLQNQWEMLEWRPREVIGDIVGLEGKLEEAWNAMDFSSTSEELLVAYEQLRRVIDVQEKEGMLMVEKHDNY